MIIIIIIFSLLHCACVCTDSVFDCISNDYVLILLLIELLSCPEVISYILAMSEPMQ